MVSDYLEGFTKAYGVDYLEIFSLVGKLNFDCTILLSLAANFS